jgi:outer membrane protein OmpA-like peptidoglycan-associated protein
MKKIALATVCFYLQLIAFSQLSEADLDKLINDSNTGKLVRTNSEMLLNGAFKQSAKIAEELVRREPDNSNFQYRLGYAYLQFHPDIQKPLEHLRIAVQRTFKRYDASSEKETNAPYDAHYYYGWALHRMEKLDEAVVEYQKYIELADKKNVLYPFAELKLQQCAVARELLARPSNDELKNLGNGINSSGPDYSALVALDGSSIYFTSRRLWPDGSNAEFVDPKKNDYLDDIYVSFLDVDDEWNDPIMLDFCKPDQHEATVSVSIDERRIYLYNDFTGNGDIYSTQFVRGKFNEISLIDKPGVNTKDWEPHLMVSPAGNTAFFVSERPGGIGGRDIYRINKLPNGQWSEPVNLGPKINTPFDEDAPFVAIDNKTLYFASNGPKSMGGFDLFVSVMDENGEWSDPINMGVPVNSTGDDAFYTTTADGLTGYITSFRKGGVGHLDLYEIQHTDRMMDNIAVLKGQIFVKDNKELPEDIAITLKCLNCDRAESRTVFPRLRDGVYFSKLEKCKEYEASYSYENGKKVFHTERFKTNCENEYEEIYRPVLLLLDEMRIVPYYKYSFDGIVADNTSKNPVSAANVEILDEKGNVLEKLTTGSDGKFKSNLFGDLLFGDKLNWKVRISKDGYLLNESPLAMTLNETQKISKTYDLIKSSVGDDLGKLLKLNPIYFDLNSSYIRKDAKVELQKIIDAMNANPNMVIECGSHTDCRASYEYNMWLSERRAQRTMEYIKKRITNPSRVTGKGYGESKLVTNCACEGNQVSDCSEEQHALNRRTEFIIIKQ